MFIGKNQLDNKNEEYENLQCILYRVLINTKKGPSWTLKSVSEQFEYCQKVLDSTHRINPSKVWLPIPSANYYPKIRYGKFLLIEIKVNLLVENERHIACSYELLYFADIIVPTLKWTRRYYRRDFVYGLFKCINKLYLYI